MEVNKVFYRYYRPLGLRSTNETYTRSEGGICLRFQVLPEGDMFFTAAICHYADRFSKVVSKKITDTRAAHLLKPESKALLELNRGVQFASSAFDLAAEVSNLCRSRQYPAELCELPSIRYHRMSNMQLAESLASLMRRNIELTLVAEALAETIMATAEPYYREKACGT